MQRINPLDGVVIPADPFHAEMFLRHAVAPYARQLRANLEGVPGLSRVDRIALTHLAVGRILGAAVFPAGERITPDMPKRCADIGVRIVAEAFDFPGPAWASTIPVADEIENWLRRNDVESRRVENGLGTHRDRVVAELKECILRNCGPERDAAQFHATAKSAMASLGLDSNESGAPEEIDYVHTQTAIAVVRRVTSGTPGGIFRGRNGKIQMGEHQFRDIIAREYGISRRDDEPSSVNMQIVGSELEQPSSLNTIEEVRKQEFAEALTAFQAYKLSQVDRDSKEARVLAFITARFLDEVQETEIAAAAGCTPAYANIVLRGAAREFAKETGRDSSESS